MYDTIPLSHNHTTTAVAGQLGKYIEPVLTFKVSVSHVKQEVANDDQ